MKPNALTRDELIEAMSPLGNRPVVWTGTGLVKDAVGSVVLLHQGDTPLIGLQPAQTQSNVGDVLTTPTLTEVRESLRVAKNRFANSFDLYVSHEMTGRDFIAVKREYDAIISRAIDALSKF